MYAYFMVIREPGIQLDCFVKGYGGQKKIISRHFKQGESFGVTDEGQYLAGRGWFVSVTLNGSEHLFVSLDDLEKSLERKEIITYADILIKLNEWHHQLNLSLDQRNKEWFKFVSRKLVKLQSILS